jgi:isopentenyl-diphosphate delta-isomerase
MSSGTRSTSHLGRRTLQPVEKLEAHQRGLRHKAISVFLMRDGKVLLQRRAMHKYHTPGLWANTCCTHPFWGEASLDCATRRLGEELGLTDMSPSIAIRWNTAPMWAAG